MLKRERRYGLCLIIFLWTTIFQGYSQGLLFYGNEKRINEKASYSVFQQIGTPTFTDELHLSFDYAVKDPKSSGYIFSIADKSSDKVFSFTYLDEGRQTCSFSLNEEGKKTYCTLNLHNDSIESPWMPISLVIRLQSGEAEIMVGKHRQYISGLNINKKTFTPFIHFGKYEHILDLAAFAIRNLSISDAKQTWNMPLNESHGNEVHDDKGNVMGWVDNPVWLINQSYYWKELFSTSFATASGLNFNSNQQKFFVFNQDSLYTYDVMSGIFSGTPYQNKLPVPLFLGMNFWNKEQNELFAYELNNIGKPTMAALNLSTTEWKEISSLYIPMQLHHHSGFYNPEKQTYTIFGGYGSRRYSNSFLTYSLQHNRWDTLHISGDRIEPRYFSGMAVTPDHKRLYLYGGMGNESGDQNVGRNYYYDLYLVDLEKQQVKKLWTQEPPTRNRVTARSMVLTPDDKYLYLLGYPEYMANSYLQLYRMSVSDGECIAVGDSIPIISEEIATNANLFYNASRGEFYCSVQEFDENGKTTAKAYSLAAPPVTLAAVKYYGTTPTKHSAWVKYVTVGLVVLIIVILFIFYYRKRNSSQLQNTTNGENESPDVQPQPTPGYSEKEKTEDLSYITDVFPTSKNAIFLFGNFVVIDHEGRDITYMFSPKLRIIFIYILLNSISKDGVLSSDMNELFWSDKPDDKIKNLKGVTMNHIRKILQDIDGLELTFQKGYFKLVFDKECYCDYLSYVSLIGKEEQSELTTTHVVELTDILSRGKFLNALESELFDYSKQKVEDFVLVFLPLQMDKMYLACKYETVIRLCNILFSIDLLSDTALKYYVGTCQKMNIPDKAIKRYNSFVKEYKREMNEEYTILYESIVL